MGQVTYLVLQPTPNGFSPAPTKKAALEEWEYKDALIHSHKLWSLTHLADFVRMN